MPKWILKCKKCGSDFEHSQIDDTGMAFFDLPPKPDIPTTGNQCVCPQCGQSAIYQRMDLLYRA